MGWDIIQRVTKTHPPPRIPPRIHPMNWGDEISYIVLRIPIDESMGWDIIHRVTKTHRTPRIPPNELGVEIIVNFPPKP
jgi:hypothetical protein